MPFSTVERRSLFSVSQLNYATKMLLEDNLSSIQVIGEISNLSRPASGHLYFTLKDTRAQIRCALFKRQAQNLDFALENGLEIIVNANTSLYEARGDYQLIINSAQTSGDGALRQAFEQLKQQLQAQGIFSTQHKKSLPKIPKGIGIITSPTGAAIRDILSVLARRFPAIPVTLYPVMVQGDNAKNQISQAIITANQRKDCDVLILARGGGSLEDLWAFNEEMVAHAIFDSHIPIISGIGHETDTSIADYVADFRAATPTAAAEHCTPDGNQLLMQFKSYEQQLTKIITAQLMQRSRHVDWLTKNLNQQRPDKQLGFKAQKLQDLHHRLQRGIQQRLQQTKQQLTQQNTVLHLHSPKTRLQRLSTQTNSLKQRLNISINHRIYTAQQQLQNSVKSLQLISPLATLERGYTLTYDTKKKIIQSSYELKTGQIIKTRLAQGSITSKIQHINHE